MSRTEAGRPPAGSAPGVGLRSERGPVLLALMLSTGLVAIDSTIIATAVPSVVANLGGFAQFPWLFSTYLLAQAVSAPIYGKLVGVGLFLTRIGAVRGGLVDARSDRFPGPAGAGRGRSCRSR